MKLFTELRVLVVMTTCFRADRETPFDVARLITRKSEVVTCKTGMMTRKAGVVTYGDPIVELAASSSRSVLSDREQSSPGLARVNQAAG